MLLGKLDSKLCFNTMLEWVCYLCKEKECVVDLCNYESWCFEFNVIGSYYLDFDSSMFGMRFNS